MLSRIAYICIVDSVRPRLASRHLSEINIKSRATMSEKSPIGRTPEADDQDGAGTTGRTTTNGATCRNGLGSAGKQVEREMDDGRPMKSAVCESLSPRGDHSWAARSLICLLFSHLPRPVYSRPNARAACPVGHDRRCFDRQLCEWRTGSVCGCAVAGSFNT